MPEVADDAPLKDYASLKQLNDMKWCPVADSP